jgi:hypothetical protein
VAFSPHHDLCGRGFDRVELLRDLYVWAYERSTQVWPVKPSFLKSFEG